MARLTGPGKKLGVSQSSNAAKVAANKAKVEANRKKVQANAAKYKSNVSKPPASNGKTPAMSDVKRTAAGSAQKMGSYKMMGYAGGATGATMSKLPKMDSTTFVNTMSKTATKGKEFSRVNPSTSRTKGSTYGYAPGAGIQKELQSVAKKYPGAKFSDFKYDPKSGSYEYSVKYPKK